MTPEQELYLANRAKEVLENEAYIKAFDDIKTELTAQWENSPARDDKGREMIWLSLCMLKKVKACLDATMDGGKLATAELHHRQTMAQRAKDWLHSVGSAAT